MQIQENEKAQSKELLTFIRMGIHKEVFNMNKSLKNLSIKMSFKSGFECAKRKMSAHANPFRNSSGFEQHWEAWNSGYSEGRTARMTSANASN